MNENFDGSKKKLVIGNVRNNLKLWIFQLAAFIIQIKLGLLYGPMFKKNIIMVVSEYK